MPTVDPITVARGGVCCPTRAYRCGERRMPVGAPRAALRSQGTLPERPLRTSTLACGWEMAWAAHCPGLGGAGDHVSSRTLDLLLHLPLCPVCTAPPTPEGALLT